MITFPFQVRMLVSFAVPDVPKSLVREQLVHKSIKDELQSILLDAKIEQAGARSHRRATYTQSVDTNAYANNAAASKPVGSRLDPVVEQPQAATDDESIS